MMWDLKFPKSIGTLLSENVMTLDWIDGVSIRETGGVKKKKFRY